MISSPIIRTNYGPVQGYKDITDAGNEYFSFQGIPYAQQPTGKLRFKDPQPLLPWTDVLDASKEGPMAFSYNPWRISKPIIEGSDACLYLNIYTSNVNPNRPLPVFVWIHGGGYNTGTGSADIYGPDYLIDRDIIVVTFNYRLGAIGFLSFKDPKVGVPGNAALKDQYMAIKWVKENIVHFGGSCTNITLAGNSSGASSVHFHLLSPMAEGLFNRAIIMSGSGFSDWAMLPQGLDFTRTLASALGYDGPDEDEEIFRFISVYNLKRISAASTSILGYKDKITFGVFTPFIPVVEPYESEMCFINRPLQELGRDAWGNNIDIIIGGTADEGLILCQLLSPPLISVIKEGETALLPYSLKCRIEIEEQRKFNEQLKNIYGLDESTDIQEDQKRITEYFTDRHVWHGLARAIRQRLHAKARGRTYLYRYAARLSHHINFCKTIRKIIQVPEHLQNGVSMTDDLPILFKSIYDEPHEDDSPTYETFRGFVGHFSRFIKCGDPNKLKGRMWLPAKCEDKVFRCLNIDEKWEMIDLPNMEKLKELDKLYEPHELY